MRQHGSVSGFAIMRRRARRCLLALTVAMAVLAGTGVSSGQTGRAGTAPWVHIESDIVPDPAVTYGVLPNGMRYALMANVHPPGAVSMRFVVGLGSFDEADNERGLAHFIEHMAFNGSKNVPEGEMVRILERLGLSFGSDTNASTSQTATVYKLDLPSNADSAVDESLILLREVASELTFDPESIERERGVVLSEYRRGDTFEWRRAEQQLEFLIPGALTIKRMPIGDPAVLETAKRADLVSLYERYYRPDRVVLIIAGDIDVSALERKIADRFGGWAGKGSAGAENVLAYIVQKRPSEASVFTHPDGGDSIAVYSPIPFEKLRDTVANRREGGLLTLARGALARRFALLAEGENPPFRSAGVSYSGLLDTVDIVSGSATVTPGDWKRGLHALEQEWRRALLYGFTDGEIAEQLAAMRSGRQDIAESEISRTTVDLVSRLTAAISEDRVFSTPSADLALFETWASKVTPEQVHDVFRKRMTADQPLFFLSTSVPQPDAGKSIPAAWAESGRISVRPPAEKPAARFAYTHFGTPGRVIRDERLADIDTRILTFANNARVSIKKTSLQKNSVLVSLRVGEGALALESAPFGLSSLMGAYTAGGLEKHSVDELRSILSGRSVQGVFSVSADSFGGTYSTTPRDLELQLQLAAAFLTHPGYRAEAERRWREGIVLSWPRLDANAQSAFSSEASRLLASGDKRFGSSPDDGVINRSFTELKAYVTPLLQDSAIEIAIVGDVDEEAAIAAVARTFGALPMRKPAPTRFRSVRPVRFRAPGDPIRLTHAGEADQAQVSLLWHVDIDPDADPQAVRVLSVLASVMRLKILSTVREELGASYAPAASSVVSATYPGLAYVVAGSEVRPEDAGRAVEALRAAAAELREGKISDDELNRAITPSLEQLPLHASSNGYWLSVISQAQSRPDRMERSKLTAVETSLKAITIADLVSVANLWLRDADGQEVWVTPSEREGSTPKP